MHVLHWRDYSNPFVLFINQIPMQLNKSFGSTSRTVLTGLVATVLVSSQLSAHAQSVSSNGQGGRPPGHGGNRPVPIPALGIGLAALGMGLGRKRRQLASQNVKLPLDGVSSVQK
jgi:hypothetical protein